MVSAKRFVRVMVVSPSGRKPSLYSEIRGGEAGVEGDGVCLEVEDEAVVQELLNVMRHLSPVDGAIVAEADFDGEVEPSVFIRMNVEGDRGRKESRGVEKEVDLSQMREGRTTRRILERRGLRDGNVLDGLAVAGLVAEVSSDETGTRESARAGEGGEKPSRR